MIFRNIQYILTIIEEQSFSKAADILYISQSALSQHVKKIEDNIGNNIFYRTPKGLKLTYIGERYVDTATKILSLDKELYNEIQDINNCNKGRLIIGIPPYRGRFFLPIVLPVFKERFPGIEVRLVEEEAAVLENIALKGNTDLTIIYLPVKTDELAYEVLCSEEILVAVPEKYIPKEKYPRDTSEAFNKSIRPEIDLSDFKASPFILLKHGRRIRELADSLFKSAVFKPNIFIECTNIETAYNLTVAGMGICIIPCDFIPETNTRFKNIKHERIYYFSLKNVNANHILVAAYLKDKYLPNAAREFISISKEVQDSLSVFVGEYFRQG